MVLLYLHGFCSDAWGRKPEAAKEECLKSGLGFVRFDYAGHGSDKENFEKTDFEIWKNQVFEIIEDVIPDSFIVAGSSMGGWLALLAALKYQERCKGLIGLAPAPNFIKRFSALIGEDQKRDLKEKGRIIVANNDFSYTITERFVETALASCLSEDEPWRINCPVHIIQGMQDASVPWREALKIAEKITSEKTEVKLLKASNHRLNDDEAIYELKSSIANLVNI